MIERAKHSPETDRDARRRRLRSFVRQAADELGSWLHGFHESDLLSGVRTGDGPSPANREQARPLSFRKRRSFRRNVEEAIDGLLPTGEVHLEALAGVMGLSRRTLQRRLSAEGAGFEALLEEVRHRRALAYLRRGRMTVKEISYRLGFSEPSAFSRAFKRWTGSSPRNWRRLGH